MFSRTQNENGNYNTRCLYCFRTIASCVETEKELALLESHHICPEMVLASMVARDESRPDKPLSN